MLALAWIQHFRLCDLPARRALFLSGVKHVPELERAAGAELRLGLGKTRRERVGKIEVAVPGELGFTALLVHHQPAEQVCKDTSPGASRPLRSKLGRSTGLKFCGRLTTQSEQAHGSGR